MLRERCFHRGCGDSGPFGHTHLTGFAYYLAWCVATTVVLVAIGLAIGWS